MGGDKPPVQVFPLLGTAWERAPPAQEMGQGDPPPCHPTASQARRSLQQSQACLLKRRLSKQKPLLCGRNTWRWLTAMTWTPIGTSGLVPQGPPQVPQTPGNGLVSAPRHRLEEQRKWVKSSVSMCAPEVWTASILGGSTSSTGRLMGWAGPPLSDDTRSWGCSSPLSIWPTVANKGSLNPKAAKSKPP